MHADERLSALGHASGSAEVAAEALSAIRRSQAGRALDRAHLTALRQQAEILDLIAAASPTLNPADTAAMLSEHGTWSIRSLHGIARRLAPDGIDRLVAASEFLRALAAEEASAKDPSRAEFVAQLCREFLSAALDLIASVNAESSFEPSEF